MHLFNYSKSDRAFQRLGLSQTAASEDDINDGVITRKCPYKVVEEGRRVRHHPVGQDFLTLYSMKYMCWWLNATLRQSQQTGGFARAGF